MDAYDDDFDPADELDPVVRELRNEIVRLEAQFDQLAAATARQEAEMELIRAETAELHRLIDDLAASRRRFKRQMLVQSVVMGAAGAVLANAVLWLIL